MNKKMSAVANLYSELESDQWRTGFSADIEKAHLTLLGDGVPHKAMEETVNEWLSRYQPCLFGKMAARFGLLRFCVLGDEDLQKSDDYIRDKIQSARQIWLADGFDGSASGFIVAAISPRLAHAEPNAKLLAFAKKLAELYLLIDVAPDEIHCDQIFLEKPGKGRRTWRWLVGCNFFSSAADQRWWHDHRFPGGIAFSMNSVGHMVKASNVNDAMLQLEAQAGKVAGEEWTVTHLESLEKALTLAMRTIKNASDASSGKATLLLPQRESDPCPFILPPDVKDLYHREYFGWYHTDITLPTEYFRADVTRPPSILGHTLDFSYLFDSHVANPDFQSMGAGLPIRDSARSVEKRSLAFPEEGLASDYPDLLNALDSRRASRQDSQL